MTEFWKSGERHYCQLCMCWMDAKPRSIRVHEEGKAHQEAFTKHQIEKRKEKENKRKEESKIEKELAEIERKAQQAFQQQDGGHASKPSTSSSTSSRPSLPSSSRPSSSAAIAKEYTAADALPDGWASAYDPTSARVYYYHAETQETRWERPSTTSLKRKREDDAIPSAPTTANAAISNKPEDEHEDEPAVPVEIDEDTGFGKWETVASKSAPSPPPSIATPSMPAQDKLEKRRKEEEEESRQDSNVIVGTKIPYNNNLPDSHDTSGSDSDDDRADRANTLLREHFGGSSAVQIRKLAYEKGEKILDEEEEDADDAVKQEDSAPIAVQFKKKRDRSANQRKVQME